MKISDFVASQRIGDKFIILNINNGVCFSLDGIGSSIWKLITQGKSIEELCDIFLETQDIFLETHDIEPAQLRLDIGSLIDDLCAVGVLELEENGSDVT